MPPYGQSASRALFATKKTGVDLSFAVASANPVVVGDNQ